jgi:hypothetical protein
MTAGGGLKWEALSLARWTGEEGAQEAARTHRPTRGRNLFTIPDPYTAESGGASRRFRVLLNRKCFPGFVPTPVPSGPTYRSIWSVTL